MSFIKNQRDSKRTTRSTNDDNSVESTQNNIPLHWIFADDSENSPVLPYNIRRNGTMFDAIIGGRTLTFATFEDAINETSTVLKPCPFSGRLVPIGPKNIGKLCQYLKTLFPDIFYQLKDESNGRIRKLFVFDDGYYIHNNILHQEMVCKYGNECHGKNGGCSFNHEGMDWCRHEKSHSSRCKSTHCRYNHMRGRVAHDNKYRNQQVTPDAKKNPKVPDAPRKNSNSNPFSVLDDTVVKKLDMDSAVERTSAKRIKKIPQRPTRKVQKTSSRSVPNMIDDFPTLVDTPYVSDDEKTISWAEKCREQKLLDIQRAKEAERMELSTEDDIILTVENNDVQEEINVTSRVLEHIPGIAYMKTYQGDSKSSSKKSSKKTKKVERTAEEEELIKQIFGY